MKSHRYRPIGHNVRYLWAVLGILGTLGSMEFMPLRGTVLGCPGAVVDYVGHPQIVQGCPGYPNMHGYVEHP